MEKQDIDIKLEVHTKQEEKATTSIPPQKTNDIKTMFAWFIFVPSIFLILLILHYFFIYFSFFKIMFFIVATISIYTYAHCAFEIHNPNSNKTLIENKWYLYNQYWLNGLGAFIGWSALYFILFYRIGAGSSPLCWSCLANIDWPDFVIGLIAFLGITGYFPYAALMGKLQIK